MTTGRETCDTLGIASECSAIGMAVFFDDAAAFRDWLAREGDAHSELVVGFRKVGSGLPSMTWPESVDEALCFGWIDGVRKRIDERAYQIRFTPRRPGSIWSAINIAKVEILTASGRMRPAGLAAFAGRKAHRSGIYAYEQPGDPALDPAELRAFKKYKAAWTYFESTPPSYRKVVVHRIVTARRDATRARRLAELMEACAQGRRLLT